MLGYACVDEDGVDATEFGVSGFETGALGGPGCYVALLKEEAWAELGREEAGWGLAVEDYDVVGS